MPAPRRRPAPAARRPAAAKKRAPARKKRRQPLPPWLLLGGGLLVGAAAVGGWRLLPAFDWSWPWAQEPAPASDYQPRPASQLSFYTLLPSQEVLAPEERAPAAKGGKPAAAAGGDGPYHLQVGSFRSRREADGMKARVALLGLQAAVETVTLRGDTWHRVRLGPYRDQARLGEVRRRLRENRIETLPVRARRAAR